MLQYTPTFSSIINSSIWRQPDHIRLVWLTLVSSADKRGVVQSSLPGLADLARVKQTLVEEALIWLMGPDPYWYHQEHQGRKIEAFAGGWVILDYRPIRKLKSKDEYREANRLRQKRFRDKHKKENNNE